MLLKRRLPILVASITILMVAAIPNSVSADDLREGVTNDAFLAIYAKHNPERDYQKAHYDAVWKAVEDTKIVDRFMSAVRKQLPAREAETFDVLRAEMEEALADVDWATVTSSCTEMVYFQEMELWTSQHVVMMRIPDGGADKLAEGLVNLMSMAEEHSGGRTEVAGVEIGDTRFSTLSLPSQVPVPFQPTVGVIDGDVFVFSSSRRMLERSMALLNDPGATSKFDDPRVAEATSKLPEMEDSMVFFDGRQLFSRLKAWEGFIRSMNPGRDEADRAATLLGKLINQFEIIDYVVTVEYTEAFQNRTSSYGKVLPGYESKVMGRMVGSQQEFENWQSWVPASASSFSLQSGANMHPLYEWVMEEVPRAFPESKDGLAQFQAIQDQFDLHLDKDFLQSFSGEMVSITLPGSTPSPFGASSQSVFMLRCSNPDRIRELINRGMAELTKNPDVQRQGIGLKPSGELEGFQEITANMLGMLGAKPVIGFHDGWMIIASHADAVQKILDARAGTGENFQQTEKFTKFSLPVSGAVSAISYSNTGQGIRDMSAAMQQAGLMLPMFLGMAGGGGGGPDLGPAQDFLALLPSIGQIVGKLDFFDSTLSVTRHGDDDLSWRQESVTLIRPPAPVEESPSR